MTDSFPEPRDLLAHAGWVRGLARALVGEDRADDLAQQTMLRALEKPPARGGDPRPWLGRVLRNLAWSDHRAEGRRRRREAQVGAAARSAVAGVPATPDALLARSEAHRLLVEDLLALEEPVRHLLILRYFEELSPTQIAERLGLPAGTVRAQLSRGLERLRSLHRRRHGGAADHSLLLLAAPPAGGLVSGAGLSTTLFLMSTARSDEPGRFTLHLEREDLRQIGITVQGGGYQPIPDDRAFDWGQRDVILRVRTTHSIPIRVVEKGSGEPVEVYSVEFAKRHHGFSRGMNRSATHSDGRFTVKGLWHGSNLIEITPIARDFARPKPIEVICDGEDLEELLIELERVVSCPIHVSWEDGEPVVGSTVTVWETPGDGEDPLAFLGYTDPMAGGRQDPPFSDRQRTDLDGVTTFFVPPGIEAFRVEVSGGHLPRTLESAALSGDPVMVVVQRGAEIAGKVNLWPGAAPERYGITLREGQWAVHLEDGDPSLTAAGTFRIPGLEAGIYEVRLWVENQFHHRGGGSGRSLTLGPPLATVELGAGDGVELVLDATGMRPGSVRGQVLVDGASPEGWDLYFQMEGPGHEEGPFTGPVGRIGLFSLGPDGHFAKVPLHPGIYRPILAASGGTSDEGNQFPHRDSFEVGVGADLERRFDFPLQSLRVRLVRQEDGSPYRHASVRFDHGYPGKTAETDDEGWFEYGPVPPEGIRVSVLDEEWRFAGQAVPAEREKLTEVVLEVPAD